MAAAAAGSSQVHGHGFWFFNNPKLTRLWTPPVVRTGCWSEGIRNGGVVRRSLFEENGCERCGFFGVVNLVDLGLIYGVAIDNRVVNVTMTLTAPGCQMGMMITQEIHDKLLGNRGCDDASVEIEWDPPWTPHMMSDAAKKQLNIDD